MSLRRHRQPRSPSLSNLWPFTSAEKTSSRVNPTFGNSFAFSEAISSLSVHPGMLMTDSIMSVPRYVSRNFRAKNYFAGIMHRGQNWRAGGERKEGKEAAPERILGSETATETTTRRRERATRKETVAFIFKRLSLSSPRSFSRFPRGI